MVKLPLAPLGLFLRALPDAVHGTMLSHLFNHMLQGQWMTEQLVDLEGKRLAIHIRDTRTQLLFVIRGKRFHRQPAKGERPWDVRISGDLADFWLLATRAEDPDTLFFSRQLAIEGETETGLYIKNMLDALDFDWDAHLTAVLGPRLAAGLKLAVRRSGMDRHIRRLTGQVPLARP
jgi:predicted lipid carrier protein YhbT